MLLRLDAFRQLLELVQRHRQAALELLTDDQNQQRLEQAGETNPVRDARAVAGGLQFVLEVHAEQRGAASHREAAVVHHGSDLHGDGVAPGRRQMAAGPQRQSAGQMG